MFDLSMHCGFISLTSIGSCWIVLSNCCSDLSKYIVKSGPLMLSPWGDPIFELNFVDCAPSTFTSSVVSLRTTFNILISSSSKIHSAICMILSL